MVPPPNVRRSSHIRNQPNRLAFFLQSVLTLACTQLPLTAEMLTTGDHTPFPEEVDEWYQQDPNLFDNEYDQDTTGVDQEHYVLYCDSFADALADDQYQWMPISIMGHRVRKVKGQRVVESRV